MFRSRFLTFVVFVSMVMALVPLGQFAVAASPNLVISQVYGGGGNSGATFKNDFIELFNRGSSPVNVIGGSETTATPTLSNTTAAIRKNAGCTETDSNVADFETGAPTPRNAASAFHFCTGDNAPAVTATSPLAGATDVGFNTDITITFSEAVNVSSAWYTISCATSGLHTAAQNGGPTTFTLDPTTDFGFSASCTVTVLASEVTDQDTLDPPNNMAANLVFSFATEAPPPPPTFIHDIQGAAHISPLNGQTLGNVPGIVTAKRPNGFNLQDPNPDPDPATSEGICVCTGSAPTSVSIRGAVRVQATVREV